MEARQHPALILAFALLVGVRAEPVRAADEHGPAIQVGVLPSVGVAVSDELPGRVDRALFRDLVARRTYLVLEPPAMKRRLNAVKGFGLVCARGRLA